MRITSSVPSAERERSRWAAIGAANSASVRRERSRIARTDVRAALTISALAECRSSREYSERTPSVRGRSEERAWKNTWLSSCAAPLTARARRSSSAAWAGRAMSGGTTSQVSASVSRISPRAFRTPSARSTVPLGSPWATSSVRLGVGCWTSAR